MGKYTDSKGREHDIELMPYTYLKNALAKLGPGRDRELADMTAEVAKRDAEHAKKIGDVE